MIGYRKDIQILRGIAVLFVVLFHFQVPFFGNGFLGVDVFFVISGFLMAGLYDQGSAIDFYKRRIDRLLPAYAALIITVIAASSLFLIPVDFTQLYEQALSSAFFAANVYFWNENSYFDKAAFNPLLNLWSLAVEVQFYLIVPFLYPLLRKSKFWFFAVALLSLSACLVVQTVSPKTAFFLTPFRVWEFLAGAWVAWAASRTAVSGRGMEICRAAALLLLISCFFIFPLKPDVRSVVAGHPGLLAMVAVLATALILYIGLPATFERSKAGGLMARIGDYSYSLYLVHFPMLVLFNYKPFGGTILGGGDALLWSFIVVATAFATWLSYTYIEKGIPRRFQTWGLSAAALVAVMLVAFLALPVNTSKFTPAEKKIFAAWTDRAPYRCGKLFRILHPADKICLIGEGQGSHRILLLGNSHADSLKTEFEKATRGQDASVYFVVQNDALMVPSMNAAHLLEEIKKYRIDSVVVHYSNIYKDDFMTQEVDTFIQRATAEGIQVAVIAPVPTYPMHVPKAMYLTEKDGEDNKVFINREQHQKNIKNFSALSQKLKARGIAVYDPSGIFCPVSACSFADEEGRPYYYDEGHLTQTGAALLSGFLQGVVTDTLANSKPNS